MGRAKVALVVIAATLSDVGPGEGRAGRRIRRHLTMRQRVVVGLRRRLRRCKGPVRDLRASLGRGDVQVGLALRSCAHTAATHRPRPSLSGHTAGNSSSSTAAAECGHTTHHQRVHHAAHAHDALMDVVCASANERVDVQAATTSGGLPG